MRVPKSSICRPRAGSLPFNGGQQRTNLADPLDSDRAEFGGMAAECIDQQGFLTNQPIVHLQNDALGLLHGKRAPLAPFLF